LMTSRKIGLAPFSMLSRTLILNLGNFSVSGAFFLGETATTKIPCRRCALNNACAEKESRDSCGYQQ